MVRITLLTIFAALLAAGCKPASTDPVPSASQQQDTNRQIYQVRGIVIEVSPLEKSVKIKHDEVPGYMPAMTMPFEVRDTNELTGIEPGHPVEFRLTVTETEGWIDQIRRTGEKTNVLPLSGPFRVVRDVEPLEIGDLLPDYQFTNQFGQRFSTSDFKGSVLAINFLFTRCPFPTMCPFTARNFANAQQALLDRPNAPTNWHLLTISFDPEFDTPEVLKSYAERYSYDSNRWTFATGALIDITAIAEQFGLVFWRDEAAGGISHNLRAVVIDPSGRVRANIAGNQWNSDELVEQIVKAAAGQ